MLNGETTIDVHCTACGQALHISDIWSVAADWPCSYSRMAAEEQAMHPQTRWRVGYACACDERLWRPCTIDDAGNIFIPSARNILMGE